MKLSNEYHFVTHWRVPASVDEVSAVLGDANDLVRWWPSVYLAVQQLESGDGDGVGARYSLYTKGWLPYSLRWSFRVTESRVPYGYSIAAEGDFVGTGVWTFQQVGQMVEITYDWRIRAEKPLLRRMSFALKPIFAANHLWAMRRGEESLRLELLRRRAGSAEEANAIAPPPGPSSISRFSLLLCAFTISLVLVARRRYVETSSKRG